LAAITAAAIGLFCLGLAVLSWRLQGFAFGIDNNVFHIPIVLHWFDLPQFARDPAIQSLRGYATPVYPLLGLVANEGNVATFFFAAFLATRALTFYALLLIMRSCGLHGRWLLGATASLALVSTLYGETGISRDELFVSIFTHTALAQAVALVAISGLLRGRLIGPAVAVGMAFDLNVMVGIWTLVPVMLAAGARLATSPHAAIRPVLLAAGAFLLSALPVGLWIFSTQHFSSWDFDYRKFLIGYYPYHFFIGWTAWPERIAFVLQVSSGMLASALLPCNRGRAALALVGFALVFAAGIAVGQLSHSRILMNLHLLRVDGMATLLVVALVAAAAFASISSGRALAALAGVVAMAGLVANDWRIVMAALLLRGATRLVAWKAGHDVPAWRIRPALSMAAASVVILVASLVWGAYSQAPAAPGSQDVPNDRQLLGTDPAAPFWLEVTQWARKSSPASAIFLVPPKLDFVAAAKRRSWVGWKEGAVVMWAPSYYPLWHARSEDVMALRSAPAALRYACLHGIDYVVLDKRPGRQLAGSASIQAVFSNRWFSVVKANRCKSAS
jgi:hypothetical protein